MILAHFDDPNRGQLMGQTLPERLPAPSSTKFWDLPTLKTNRRLGISGWQRAATTKYQSLSSRYGLLHLPQGRPEPQLPMRYVRQCYSLNCCSFQACPGRQGGRLRAKVGKPRVEAKGVSEGQCLKLLKVARREEGKPDRPQASRVSINEAARRGCAWIDHVPQAARTQPLDHRRLAAALH
jgi:hypothetical protein